MKTKVLSVVTFLFFSLFAVSFLSSCSKDNSEVNDVTNSIGVHKIKITVTGDNTLYSAMVFIGLNGTGSVSSLYDESGMKLDESAFYDKDGAFEFTCKTDKDGTSLVMSISIGSIEKTPCTVTLQGYINDKLVNTYTNSFTFEQSAETIVFSTDKAE